MLRFSREKNIYICSVGPSSSFCGPRPVRSYVATGTNPHPYFPAKQQHRKSVTASSFDGAIGLRCCAPLVLHHLVVEGSSQESPFHLLPHLFYTAMLGLCLICLTRGRTVPALLFLLWVYVCMDVCVLTSFHRFRLKNCKFHSQEKFQLTMLMLSVYVHRKFRAVCVKSLG